MIDPSRWSPEQLAQLVQQAAQAQAQQQVLMNRARIHMGELIDALLYTCMAAESGNGPARSDLQMFLQALDRAKAASVGIATANGFHATKQ